MATLWVQEYSSAGVRGTQIGKEPAITSQTVTFTSSTASSAFHPITKFVRVIADVDCHLAFGVSPTATSSGMKLMAGSAEYFGVRGGDKVAAVAV